MTYVYDCGSINPRANRMSLSREIAEFGARMDSLDAEVDVMFISHFDEDHVFGIPELTRRVKVRTFIIPMIPGADRLLFYADAVASGTMTPGSGSFYERFLSDPVETLRETGAERVIEVPQGLPPNDGQIEDEVIHYEDLAPDLPSRGSGPAGEDVELKVTVRSATISRARDVVWEWRYSQSEQATSVTSELSDELIALGSILTASDLEDPSIVKSLVQNDVVNLIKAYRVAIATVGSSFTLNLSSLMLYSGPPVSGTCIAHRSRTWIDRAEVGAWGARPAFLGLGDADIRSNGRLDHVKNVFKSRHFRVGTFAPSHHGSHRDWDVSLLDGLGGGAPFRPTLVFGASGAHGHPHHNVLLEANEAGATTLIVGLEERSRWTESFTAFYQP